MKNFQVYKPHLIAVISFLAVTLVYFHPLMEGKDVRQMDMNHTAGMSRELTVYHDTTGDYSQWTNSMFGGMPAYHVGPFTPNHNFFSYLHQIISLGLSPNSAGIMFAMMLCFYILLVVLKVNPWLAMAGAFAYAFSTYNPIIIAAGHVTKAQAMAYIPLIIAGLILTYRGKYSLGGILTMLGFGLNISRNHFQITYYVGFIILVFAIGYFIEAYKKKEFRKFFISSAIVLAAAIISILPNAVPFYTNYELGKTSIRSSSELSARGASQRGGGLDKDYAFSWSYGKMESFTILIPGFKGGSSIEELTTDSELYKALRQRGVADAEQYIKQAPLYWGDMPFTSGPVYHGAVICFLFVLGLYIIKGNIRWYLLIATVLSLFLSWGYHFAWFNDLMFYHFPLYSKFRTVSMSLIIAQFTMPFMAMLALWEIFSNPGNKKQLLKGLKWSTIITGGITLFIILFGRSMFDFRSVADARLMAQVPDWYYNALLADRAKLMTADAFRSLIFILLSAAVIYFIITNKKWLKYLAPAFILLVLFDLWPVAKRYLSEEDFVRKNVRYDFQPSTADNQILQDESLSYRVLNLNNPFNEVNTSFFHKSIGGYHGAKQRRYQELIEEYLQTEVQGIIQTLSDQASQGRIDSVLSMNAVLNMLNTRYIIYNPSAPPLVNIFANGNAWFAKEYFLVDNADEEMEALGIVDPAVTALIDKRYAGKINGFTIAEDPDASIELISYRPNELVYAYSASKPRLVLFSEVFYPYGWKAFVNGKQHEHFRSNWLLRAMLVPEGEHEIRFVFEPKELYVSQSLALWSSILIGIFVLSALGFSFYRKSKNSDTPA